MNMVGEAASSPDGSLSTPPKSPHSPEGPNSSTDNGNSNSSTIRVLGGAFSPSQPAPAPSPATTSAAKNTPTQAPATTPTSQIVTRKKPGPKPKPKDPNAPPDKPKRRRRTQAQIAEDNARAAAEAAALAAAGITPVTRKKRQTKTDRELQAAQQQLLLQQQQEAEARARAEAAEAQQAHPQSQLHAHPQHHQHQLQPQQQQPQQQQQPSTMARDDVKQTHGPMPQSRQPKLTDLVSVIQPQPSPVPRVASTPETLFTNPNLSHINVAPSTPRPASSGQVYDPIRSAFDSKPQHATAPVSPPLNRASASPSITSLIDPPSAANLSYTQTARLQQQQASHTSAPVSPAAIASRPAHAYSAGDQQQNPQQQQLLLQPHPAKGPIGMSSTPMEIDNETSVPMRKTNSTSTSTASAAPTPPVKPARQKEAPPPLPAGSGLLSGTPFGPMAASNGAPSDQPGVNIWISVPIKNPNMNINFAREVEKKYGHAALFPRIAARRERQRQLAAAGAALEKGPGASSADDMSVDLVSEPDSNVEMGGMDENTSNQESTKKRRKRKQEDYDKDDDFIDDTELAWEQQALMAKDGFFVYSGPLVEEGQRPAVERADGTVRRGRGRGRGGSTRGETSGRGRGRGGGPGSRGGQTVRKPRVTKADRALMEQEKLERERIAASLTAKQPGLPGYATGPLS